jgi:hypothetical protein
MSSTRADRGQNECVQMTRADLLTSARDRLPGRRQVAVSTVSAPRAHCSNGEAGHVQTRVGPVLAKTTVTRTSSGPGIGVGGVAGVQLADVRRRTQNGPDHGGHRPSRLAGEPLRDRPMPLRRHRVPEHRKRSVGPRCPPPAQAAPATATDPDPAAPPVAA